MDMKVLVSDSVAEEGLEKLKKEGLQVDIETNLSQEELLQKIGNYQGLIVRSATQVTREVIEQGEELKVIGRAGVGTDNIDVEAATERGIIVVNSPAGNTIAAVEHTMGMMLALARNIPQASNLLKQGKWERGKFTGVEFSRKTLGIVGLGKIGSEIAKRAWAMEMKVLAHDPYVDTRQARRIGVDLVELEELLREADFITVHLPLVKKTRHLIGEKELKMMKPGVRILNVARGGIIEEKALYEALQTGHVAGAALDVFEKEPAAGNPLLELDNVIATPHLGASTEEAQVNVSNAVAEEFLRAYRGELIKNAVNIPQIKSEVREVFEPYLLLAEKLGCFVVQLIKGGIKEVELSYAGQFAQHDTAPLTSTFLKGVLRPALNDAVNFVNAPIMAKARGIKVYEKRSTEIEDYASLITCRVKSATEERMLAGTLLRSIEPRVIRINGYSIDIVPEGHILIISHVDRPRIIGLVTTLIGDNKINIAGMQMGRKEAGGTAIMVLSVDNPVPESSLQEISAIEGVVGVQLINL